MLASVSQAFWSRSNQLLTTFSRNAGLMQWQQQRSVVIVRRLVPPPIPKLGRSTVKVKRSTRVYILDEDTTHQPREKLRLILTDDVPKVGNKGEVVMVDKRIGRNKLIPSGQAVYASPENLKEFALERQKEKTERTEDARLSPMAIKTIEYLKQKSKLEVRMHAESEWDTLGKEHVIHAFRHRLAVVVPEHALTLPESPITEVGTYPISVTINGIETIPMELEVIRYQPKRKGQQSEDTETTQEEETR